MSRTRPLLIAAAVGIVAVAAGALLGRTLFGESAMTQASLAKATLLTPPKHIQPFSLTDIDSRVFDNSRLAGHWTLMFFGFTHCPDVCPTTLATLALLAKQLEGLPDAKRPHVVLVSVDPERDTPALLGSYIRYFNPGFTGVTGPPDAVAAFTQAMNVPVAFTKLPNGDYTVDHSAAIFLINPQGDVSALFSTPHQQDILAADYRTIVSAR